MNNFFRTEDGPTPWFAWKPVVAEDHEGEEWRIWLEYVEREIFEGKTYYYILGTKEGIRRQDGLDEIDKAVRAELDLILEEFRKRQADWEERFKKGETDFEEYMELFNTRIKDYARIHQKVKDASKIVYR